MKAPASERAGLLAAAAALVVLGALTAARNRVWRTEETLWADVVAGAPDSTRAQMNYGLALMEAGRLADAEPHLREAVRLGPTYPYAYLNLGQLRLAQGRKQEARALLDQAVALGPELVYAQFYRGLAAEQLGELPDVRARYFARAAGLSPAHADAQYHLALALSAGGDGAGAERVARQAVRLRGSFDDRFLLAFLLLQRREAREAMPLLETLRRERPDDARVEHDRRYAQQLLGGEAP